MISTCGDSSNVIQTGRHCSLPDKIWPPCHSGPVGSKGDGVLKASADIDYARQICGRIIAIESAAPFKKGSIRFDDETGELSRTYPDGPGKSRRSGRLAAVVESPTDNGTVRFQGKHMMHAR